MTTIIFQAGWVVPLIGQTTNGPCRPSCRNGPPASRAGLCRPTGWSGSPSTTCWLIPCQAQPIALRAVSCLGQAKFCMSCADPFGPARKYRTSAGFHPLAAHDVKAHRARVPPGDRVLLPPAFENLIVTKKLDPSDPVKIW
jgi:hypothetical protein